MRIGTTVIIDYETTSWKHLECFKIPAHLPLSAIKGIDTLKAEDQASVSDWYSNPVAYERKRKADRLAQAVAAASGNAAADAAPCLPSPAPLPGPCTERAPRPPPPRG